MTAPEEHLIAVYIVTYRRPQMLKRALESALRQTYKSIVVRVVNDDPEDASVQHLIDVIGDKRVQLHRPLARRGATRNFNLIFSEEEASFVSLLEDDNWWEPDFLSTMLRILLSHPKIPVVVGNERIWKELPGGQWVDTGETIWQFEDTRLHYFTLERICGSATICNSSMLFRLPDAASFLTPDSIPVDVTEHFRERLLPSAILLCGKTLVNYAETIRTTRSQGTTWGEYQTILVGSVFQALSTKRKKEHLGRALWAQCPSATSPRAVTLVMTGFAVREASVLLKHAPVRALLRTAVRIFRHPREFLTLLKAPKNLKAEVDFLVNAALTRSLSATYDYNFVH